MDELPLVDKTYRLEKFPGKGGWTYTMIPEILQNPKNPFGWVKVKGSIDDYELSQYKLMPMGNGQLFLPVKAEIRKKIKKQAGDEVHLILYADDSKLEIPEEIIECLELESKKTYQKFLHLTEGQQKAWVDWVYDTRNETTREKRIVKLIDCLEKGTGFYDK